MSSTYAIDPGTERSALVFIGPTGIISAQMWENRELARALRDSDNRLATTLVLEQVESYGMPVGKEVFTTVFWAGRFAEAWECQGTLRCTASLLPRRAVKLALCGSVRANDASIRQALIDRYGPGKERAIGTKKHPGPLYGLKGDLWAALALGVTFLDAQKVAAEDVA